MNMIFVLMLAVPVTANSTPFFDDSEYLMYEEFIQKVDAGNVKSVTLDRHSQINGTYLVEGEEVPFRSYGEVGTANDTLLVRELKGRNIPIEVLEGDRSPSLFKFAFPALIFVWGVPLVTLIMVLQINGRVSRIEKAQQAQLRGGSDGSPSQPVRAEQPLE